MWEDDNDRWDRLERDAELFLREIVLEPTTDGLIDTLSEPEDERD